MYCLTEWIADYQSTAIEAAERESEFGESEAN